MNVALITEIERSIQRLTVAEQLSLLEILIHNLKERYPRRESISESMLTEMASDPEIQTELKLINDEFTVSELDGLEGV